MSSQDEAAIEISFEGWNLQGDNLTNIRDHVDFGDLVAEFTRPLEHWQLADYAGGRMKTAFERRHEWEAVLTITLIGVGAFSTAFCAEFGKRTAGAIWDWGKNKISVMRANKDDDDDEQIGGPTALAKVLSFEEIVGPGTHRRTLKITPK